MDPKPSTSMEAGGAPLDFGSDASGWHTVVDDAAAG